MTTIPVCFTIPTFQIEGVQTTVDQNEANETPQPDDAFEQFLDGIEEEQIGLFDAAQIVSIRSTAGAAHEVPVTEPMPIREVLAKAGLLQTPHDQFGVVGETIPEEWLWVLKEVKQLLADLPLEGHRRLFELWNQIPERFVPELFNGRNDSVNSGSRVPGYKKLLFRPSGVIRPLFR